MAETKKKTASTSTTAKPKTATKTAQKAATTQKEAVAAAEKTYTKAELDALIKEAVAAAVAQAAANQTPQIVQVAADVEKVQFLFQAEVSDENVYEVGPQGMFGRVVGKTGSFTVPKSELSRAMDGMFRLLVEKRWIIAVSGLTDEEREIYGMNYKEGEILDKRAFARMVELGDEILNIYPQLCKGHREMVAKRYHEAFENGSPYVTRSRVVELNKMSKQLGSKNGDFTDIIEKMNVADAE